MGGLQGSGGREAVLVLGYKNRGTRANYINRFRVRAALRSQDCDAQESVLVLCGGSVAGEIAEADLLARYARFELGYTGPILTEPDSRTTWENIQNAIPLIEEFDVIKIVSNSLHAEKARAYVWKLRPDLAQRLVAAKEYRFGEMTFVKPVAALIGLENLRGIESAPETGPRA
ncbi:YdcF family protein [Glaciibacter superstes]|uniref:YdcF family protein n=1 Tax=Glaciibacter superstes TaxID=501023 RepID=UPI001FDF9D66|nr:YdcF family protein [Glaciibacter superstes]